MLGMEKRGIFFVNKTIFGKRKGRKWSHHLCGLFKDVWKKTKRNKYRTGTGTGTGTGNGNRNRNWNVNGNRNRRSSLELKKYLSIIRRFSLPPKKKNVTNQK